MNDGIIIIMWKNPYIDMLPPSVQCQGIGIPPYCSYVVVATIIQISCFTTFLSLVPYIFKLIILTALVC